MDSPPEPSWFLQRMYEEGKYCDLHIHTSTSTLSAHKSIVCRTSQYFEERFPGDGDEAVHSTMVVPEDRSIMDEVLRYCYGIWDSEIHDCSKHARHQGCCSVWLEIAFAADKYQLPCLKSVCIDPVLYRLTEGYAERVETLVGNAVWLYEGNRRAVLGPEIGQRFIVEIARLLEYIQSEDEEDAWQSLLTCSELLGDVVKLVASQSQAVEHVEKTRVRSPYLRKKGD